MELAQNLFLLLILLILLTHQTKSLVSASHHHHGYHHHHKHHHLKHQYLFGSQQTKLFVFGDSYSDTGNNIKSVTKSWKYPYGITFPGRPTGRFSDGRVLTDYLAKFVGVKSPIPYKFRNVGRKHLKYGMNFAYGGTGVFDTLAAAPNMTTQIGFFQQFINDTVFTAQDVHSSVGLITLAGNDYAYYLAVNNNSPQISLQGFKAFITSVVNKLSVNLRRVSDLGVKKIVVTALQPLGCLPGSTAEFSFQKCNATQNLLVSFHNLLLHQAVAKLNNETKTSSFIVLDLYTSFMSVLQNKGNHPGSMKFENPLKPCCVGISSGYDCGSVDDNGAKMYTICDDPAAAFFWDGAHPTQQGWFAVYSALQATLEELYQDV